MGGNGKRVMIAAPKSGSGKTTVTCALLGALKESGLRVAACKCGPDYIDPLFHEQVLGVPSKNLDTFFTGEEQTKCLFRDAAVGRDIVVLEGVMGLYDGLGGVREEGSSYHLAQITETPVVLVADVKGMGRSMIPMLAGFLSYDKAGLIRGVILNRISEGYFKTIKPLIEEELKLKVAGFLPEREELCLESRHLGLVLPGELGDIRERVRAATAILRKTVSLSCIMEIAREGGGSSGEVRADRPKRSGTAEEKALEAGGGPREKRPLLGVARDEAFCFYYADNIRLLEKCGAEIAYFSPLRDESLPEGCCGLLLGGGYPELFADGLSENRKMREAVKRAAKSGMPVVAECGGFLYLHEELTDRQGKRYEMAGVVPGTCFDTGKLVRFGYLVLRERHSLFLPAGQEIKGHEFHYFDSTCNGEDAVAIKPVTGREYSCMIEEGNLCLGFPHLYYPSNPAFAARFVEKAGEYQGGRNRKAVAPSRVPGAGG